MCIRDSLATARAGSSPVSYTHLDVYKRQPGYCACRIKPCLLYTSRCV
ncbi:hypothetical protein [Burkholderia plantarii]|nr:hypothetical protein [Burkholderia plantarii]